MNVFLLKIIGGILLFACMIIFGMLPIYNRHFKGNLRLLSYCNCFSGGLFIGIGLIHILPEAHELLDEKMSPAPQNGDILGGCSGEGIQLSYLICLLSFSTILLIDKVFLIVYSSEL